MLQLFQDHPKSVGENYFQHLCHASGFGLRMVIAGLACLLHAVFPFVFVHTGSGKIADLNRVLEARNAQASANQ